MSETTNNPQPSDPPVGGSGGGTAPNTEDIETADAQMSEPPTGGSGGGS